MPYLHPPYTTKSRLRPQDFTRTPPSHRHSGPSAPWPWINLHDEVDAKQLASTLPPIPEFCDHSSAACKSSPCWTRYPSSRFPNWTPSQVFRSGIHKAITDPISKPCTIYAADVDNKGYFTNAEERTVTADPEDVDKYWWEIVKEKRPENLRVRAFFVENMSGPVLQMLGARYNIEPFYFSSSLSWIPSRFQEEVRPKKGDHITITLTFLRTMDTFLSGSNCSGSTTVTGNPAWNDEIINTHAPLYLSSVGAGCYLVLDLLAVHLIRNTEGNTIISYHHTPPGADPNSTSAQYLHERIRFAGQSVYWQNIFQKSPDPTFVLLTFIWHAMYAWDEALEVLYNHICWMESQVLDPENMHLTRTLHIIRAHLLHYSSLLQDFRKAVTFILDTPNPALDSPTISADYPGTTPEELRLFSKNLLQKECKHLLSEIDRLEMGRQMQDKRLKNVMNLVFSTVNIGDSRKMQDLTEAAVRDSAAMKQIAYLSMVFLPASFVAALFGMNVHEISPDTKQSLPHYFAVAMPLTAATIWLVMTIQSKYLLKESGVDTTFLQRLAWPWLLFKELVWAKMRNRGRRAREGELGMSDSELPMARMSYSTRGSDIKEE